MVWSDLVLFAASVSLGLCWLGLGLIVLLGGPAGARWVNHKARPSPSLQLVVGQQSDTGYAVRLPAYIPLLNMRWEVAGCQAEAYHRHGYLRERLRPHRRGAYNSLRRRFCISDCLGLFRYRWTATADSSLRVLPSLGAAPPEVLAKAWRAGSDLPSPEGKGGDALTDIRQYRSGDPFRHILWTLYARTQKLMVRVTEPAVSLDFGVCIYLATDQGDESAAAVARALLEGLDGPQWRFGADGMPGGTSSPSLALRWLSEAPVSAGLDLGPFLEQARADGFGRCVVLAKRGSAKAAEAHRLGMYSPIETTVVGSLSRFGRLLLTCGRVLAWLSLCWYFTPAPSLLACVGVAAAAASGVLTNRFPAAASCLSLGLLFWSLCSGCCAISNFRSGYSALRRSICAKVAWWGEPLFFWSPIFWGESAGYIPHYCQRRSL